jgi:hypothetical protein
MNATAAALLLPRLLWDQVRILFYAVPQSEMVAHLPVEWRQPHGAAPHAAHAANAQNALVTPELLAEAALPPYTLLAIPGFVLLCTLELLVGLCRGRRLYRASDGVVSMLLGLVMILTGFLTGAAGLAAYCYVWSRYAWQGLVPLDSAGCWVGLLLGVDFGYYWFHRTAHEYHLSWSAHSVHHSGEVRFLPFLVRCAGLVGFPVGFPVGFGLNLVGFVGCMWGG